MSKPRQQPYPARDPNAPNNEALLNFPKAQWKCPGCGRRYAEELFRRADSRVCVMCQIDQGGKPALALLTEPFSDLKWRQTK